MTDNSEATPAAKTATKRPRKMARQPKPETAGQGIALAPVGRVSKTGLALDLLQRPKGATIDQLVAVTGWLPHTTRAALTGLRKKGHSVTSEKLDGVRHYRTSAGTA